MGNIYSERLEEIRSLMRARGWDALVLSGSDPHCSEYPAARWKQIEWITGFTGEAADIVITQDHAGLWTDSRYFIQAGIQLDGTGFTLHKTRVPDQVLIPEWIRMNLDQDSVLVFDGSCQCVSAVTEFTDEYSVANVPNLIDVLWKNRPGIPQTPVYAIEAGQTRASKLDWLREFIAGRGASGMLVSALDEVAWLLNIRASDIEYNPMAIAYLLVREDDASLFILKDEEPDPDSCATFDILRSQGIHILPYSDVELVLSEGFEGRLLMDGATVNYNLWSLCSADVELCESPVQLRKAIKNDYEIQGMRKAHLLDGIAMENFLYWLEKSVQGQHGITEWDAAVKLGKLRAQNEGYTGDSFETISAYGPGAALPHYSTPEENAPMLLEKGLYLCDSGAQYEFGTTDITRTVPLGECTSLEKEDYTLVLKGHIDLAMAVFPEGTAGCHLDVLARNPLWASKRNFGHGTGHGVGFFLGVHEGPHAIRQNFNSTALQAGMISSDEPGIYREGKHGVRHENLILCKEAGTNSFGKWMEFETLTLCHFDTSAIVKELLGEAEREWLNRYNRRVYESLSPYLSAEVRDWLGEKTAAI